MDGIGKRPGVDFVDIGVGDYGVEGGDGDVVLVDNGIAEEFLFVAYNRER